MTADELLADGWTESKPNPQLDSHDRQFGLTIRDPESKRKLYTAFAKMYCHSKYQPGHHDGWELVLYFNDGAPWHSPAAMRVTAYGHVAKWSASEARKWADEIFRRLECHPYEMDDE